jgi:hypothetical protein
MKKEIHIPGGTEYTRGRIISAPAQIQVDKSKIKEKPKEKK